MLHFFISTGNAGHFSKYSIFRISSASRLIMKDIFLLFQVEFFFLSLFFQFVFIFRHFFFKFCLSVFFLCNLFLRGFFLSQQEKLEQIRIFYIFIISRFKVFNVSITGQSILWFSIDSFFTANTRTLNYSEKCSKALVNNVTVGCR